MKPIIVYKESLEHGRLPKNYRKDRNEAFLKALPEIIPKDLSDFMLRNYVAVEPDDFAFKFEEFKLDKNALNNVAYSDIIGYIVDKPKNTSPLFIKTPIMSSPFGITEMPFGDENSPKYNLSLSIDIDKRSHKIFYENIKHIEQKAKEHIMESNLPSFRMSRMKEYLDECFTNSITQKEGYPPLFRIKIPTGLSCFDANNSFKSTTFEQLIQRAGPGNSFQIVFRVQSLWCCRNSFGLRYVPRQIVFKKNVKKIMESELLDEYMFDSSTE